MPCHDSSAFVLSKHVQFCAMWLEHLMFGSALSITCWVSCPLDENLVTLACMVKCFLKRTMYPYGQFGWTTPSSAFFSSWIFSQTSSTVITKCRWGERTHLQEPSLSFSSVNFTVKLKMSHFLHAQLKSLSWKGRNSLTLLPTHQ